VKSSPLDTLLERPRRQVPVEQLQPMDLIPWSGTGRGGKPRRAVITGRGSDGTVHAEVIGIQGNDRQVHLPVDGPGVDVLGRRTERMRLARQTPAALALDPRAALVYALESYNAESNTATKSSLLTSRALRKPADPGTITDPDEALLLVLDQAGTVDLSRVASLMGLDEATTRVGLAGKVFTDPATGQLVTREEYLSGDVRAKLRQAQALLPGNPDLAGNVEPLTDVLPEWVTSDRVQASPGASWIAPEYIQAFLAEILDDPKVSVSRVSGATWLVTSLREGDRTDHLINSEWGTPDRTAYQLMDGLLHRTTHRITRTDPDTLAVTVDRDATKAANDQADKMLSRFREWIWEDPDRAETLLQVYNDMFNTLVRRAYSTRHLHPAGMSEALTLYGHQAAGVRRILGSEGVILAHDVGAGKTFTISAAAMELGRLGHATKPLIVVPNHLKEQWQREFLTAFPAARVLAASTDDITATGRAEFLARAAVGDWDAIILTRQAFASIPMSKDFHRSYIEQHVNQMRALVEAAQAAGAEDKTVKEFERLLATREQKLFAKVEARKDDGLPFELLGSSYVFVDEADAYKNLERISNTPEALEGSDLAFDLDMKLTYLREVNRSGRVVTLATATPVANSISETHTMQKYTRPDLLTAAGVEDFDTWLANFARTEVRF
jgi:N12 class adenine-specific DNA methylase